MSRLIITLNLDNDAMQDETEIGRILHDLSQEISLGKIDIDEFFTHCSLADINGNTVGSVEFDEDEEDEK